MIAFDVFYCIVILSAIAIIIYLYVKLKQPIINLINVIKSVYELLRKFVLIKQDLVNTIKTDIKVADHQERYKTLMTKQYKNMKYEIKDEIIEDNNAVVEAEITVYDYGSAIRKANEYLNSHPDEFKKEDKTTAKEEEDTVTTNEKSDGASATNTDYDEDKFMEYKISEMEKVTDTVKYTIEFTLTKVNGEWQLDQLSNSDIEKLHGIYTS